MLKPTARVTPRRSSRITRSGISVALVSTLILSLMPVADAQADHHNPWDQAGSYWQGTIDTVWHVKDSYVWEGEEQQAVNTSDGVASYSGLEPMEPSANGKYRSYVVTEGTERYNHEGGYYEYESWDWAGTPNPGWFFLHLRTDDAGRTYITPQDYRVPGRVTWGDAQSGPWTSPTHVHTLGYVVEKFDQYGQQHYSDKPVPDDDADPLHLVGEKTWTTGDLPLTQYSQPPTPPEEYEFTIRYDLRLMSACENQVTHDIYRARLPGFEEDLLEFELRTNWCNTPQGQVRIIDFESENRTLNSPLEHALEGVVREVVSLHDVWRPIDEWTNTGERSAAVTATGNWEHCWGIPIVAGKVKKLAKLFKLIGKQLPKKVRWAADEAADLANAAAKVGKRLAKKALKRFEAFVSRLPHSIQTKLTVALIAVMLDHAASEDWAKDFLLPSPSTPIEKILGNDELMCTTDWIPMIRHLLHADGSATAHFVDLEDDYPNWEVRRTGGS